MGMFFDQDIAHIARVMVPSLIGDLGGPMGKVRPISSGSPDTVRVPRKPKRNQLRTRNRVVHLVRHATDHGR